MINLTIGGNQFQRLRTQSKNIYVKVPGKCCNETVVMPLSGDCILFFVFKMLSMNISGHFIGELCC